MDSNGFPRVLTSCEKHLKKHNSGLPQIGTVQRFRKAWEDMGTVPVVLASARVLRVDDGIGNDDMMKTYPIFRC